jgi:hypothetical protein
MAPDRPHAIGRLDGDMQCCDRQHKDHFWYQGMTINQADIVIDIKTSSFLCYDV